MRLARLSLGGKLDRYVGGLLLGAYMTSLLLVVGLAVILDVASNLKFFEPWDDGTNASTQQIVRYYALNTPFLFLQVAPFVMVSAALFTLMKLVRHNELVAALNAGVSTQRLLLAVFAAGALAALGMFVLREKATAALGQRRDALKYVLARHKHRYELDNVWFRDVAGNIVRIESFVPEQPGEPVAHAGGLEVATQSSSTIRVVRAERATWTGAGWRLDDGSLREETGNASQTRAIDTLEGVIEFTPRDLLLSQKGFEQPLELSFSELEELIARDPENRQYQTLLQYHLTFPLANLVLLLVTLPLLVGRDRGRRIEGLAMACGMCVIYFAFDFVSRSLGMDGSLSPLLASWLPVLFFGSLGTVLFEGLRT